MKKKKKMMPFQRRLGALLKLLNKKKKASGSLFTCILFHSLFSYSLLHEYLFRGHEDDRLQSWAFTAMMDHRTSSTETKTKRPTRTFFFSYSFLSSPYTQNGDENSLRRRNHVRIIFEECFKNPSAV